MSHSGKVVVAVLVVALMAGAGLLAVLMQRAAPREVAVREDRDAAQSELAAMQAEISQTLCPSVELNNNVDLLVRTALLDAGCYQHARSEWRRRRHAKQKTEDR